MGRTPVKLKEVIYGISSNKVEIMGSLGRDALSAISKKIGGGWFDVTVFGIAPTVGTVMYVYCFLSSIFCFQVVFCCCFRKGRRFGFSLSLVLFLNAEQMRRRGTQRRERERRKNPRDHRLTLLSLITKQVRAELQRTRETPPQILIHRD